MMGRHDVATADQKRGASASASVVNQHAHGSEQRKAAVALLAPILDEDIGCRDVGDEP